VDLSLALAYLDGDVLGDHPPLHAVVAGDPRPVTVLPAPPYDPDGERFRATS